MTSISTPPGASRLHRPVTLRAKLVASVLALFFVVTAATGALTVFLLRQSLTQQLDQDLQQFAQRIDGRIGPERPEGRPLGPPPGGGSRTLHVELVGGVAVENQAVTESNTLATLSTEQVARLNGAQLGLRPKTVDLGGEIGSYRLVAAATSDGGTSIFGVPTAGLDAASQQVILLVLVSTGLGLVLVAVGGTLLVRRSLAPLDRVAATATRVSRLPLDTGSVDLGDRVPEADTDPRTEVGQVGLALNEMLDHVHEALSARHESELRVRRFVADASHELRTPLASIRGYAELTRREREPIPPAVSHAIGRVESETLRMTELVEDLLLLARLDAGRPLERQPVDVSLLAMDAVSDAHAAAPEHQWELDLPDEPVEVTGDQARLHQVLVNLLANARTHTPPGTRVTTSVSPEGDWVRISVRDNGPGVPEPLQRNVFQRFTRGDDSRNRAAGSTGLGLSIVDAVAQSHGGQVRLDSVPGETTFSVLLPVG